MNAQLDTETVRVIASEPGTISAADFEAAKAALEKANVGFEDIVIAQTDEDVGGRAVEDGVNAARERSSKEAA